MTSIREGFDQKTAAQWAALVEKRKAAAVAAGWEFNHLEPPGFTAVKALGGYTATQMGETLEELLERVESWERSQQALKPEHRIGYEQEALIMREGVIRAEGARTVRGSRGQGESSDADGLEAA